MTASTPVLGILLLTLTATSRAGRSVGRDSRPGGAAGRPGEHGATRVLPGGRSSAPLELRASYFLSEGVVQEYVVPGDPDSSPRGQEVEIVAVGGGGGGCDGGRGEVTTASFDRDEWNERGNSQGGAGGHASATFVLQAGERLQVVVGGGGGSTASVSGSLGGKGGYNGGMDGRQDDSSGGGGGGGMTVVSRRKKVIVAAYGGRGGGNTTYCTALGGAGGKLKGEEDAEQGYIDADLLAVSTTEDTLLGEINIVSLTHSSIELAWSSGIGFERRLKQEEYPHSYLVHLAEVANDNDELVCDRAEYTLRERVLRGRRPSDNSTSNIRGLEHSTRYCVKIETLSFQGLSLGSKSLHFKTSRKPVNEWRELRSLDGFATAELGLGGNRTICERAGDRPTPRRGHSLSVVDGIVYIFGGATKICACEEDSQGGDRCELRDVYSDELWRLDTATGEFVQLDPPPGSPRPSPREQHSATVLANGDILVIGGVTSVVGGGAKLVNDAHVLSNPERTATRRYRGVDVDVRLAQGKIMEHRLLTVPSRDEKEETCIHELEMRLQMDHGCPRSIEHVRLGHVDSSGIERGVEVLVASTESRQVGCEHSFIDLRLSDGADEWILDWLKFPMKGKFRPANSLFGTFGGIPFDGNWSVAIAHSEQSDWGRAENATLVGWELGFVTKPCYPSAKWTTLEVPSDFKPRRLHTAVAVENSVFVAGGISHQYLDDLWRYDHDLSHWVELKSSPVEGTSLWHGQAGMLTPGGAVIAFGGLSPNERLEPGQDVWTMDPFDEAWEWRPVPVLGTPQVPYPRYLSSFGLLVKDKVEVGTQAQWKGVVFGGGGGGGSSSLFSLFDDAWLLIPGGIEAESDNEQRRRAELCEWRVLPFSTADRSWRNSCGYDPRDELGPPPQGCCLLSIFVRAWCREQYQSFWL